MTTIVPGDDKLRPLHANRFFVEVKTGKGKKIEGVFTEMSGLSIDIKEAVSEASTLKGDFTRMNTPGTVEYGDVTLKREFHGDRAFYDWLMVDVATGKESEIRGEVSIVLYARGGEEASRWNLLACWPSKWSVSDVDVGSDDVMIEEVTLQVEQMERTS